jgi:hypothetical protein
MLLVMDLNSGSPAECILIVSLIVSDAMLEIPRVPINDNIEIENLCTPTNPNAKEV